MTDFDLVVVGNRNADLLISGGDVVPAFSQRHVQRGSGKSGSGK